MASDGENNFIEPLDNDTILNIPVSPPRSVNSLHYSFFPEFRDHQFQQLFKMYVWLIFIMLFSFWFFAVLFFVIKLINL